MALWHFRKERLKTYAFVCEGRRGKLIRGLPYANQLRAVCLTMASNFVDDDTGTEVSDLEEISFSALVNNFDGYSAAFNWPPNCGSVPRIFFDFLARRYTQKLFSRLLSAKKLKPQHMGFLVNPHLTELDLVGIDVAVLPGLVDMLESCENSILSFKAKSKDIQETIQYERLMTCLPNVTHIEYKGVSSDKFVGAIGTSCPRLKVLLFECPEIQGVDQFNDGISVILSGCPELEILKHADTIGVLHKMNTTGSLFKRINRKSALRKSKKYILKTLSSDRYVFSKYSLADALDVCTAVCPYVSYLRIDHLRNRKELYKCLKFPFLEDVKFERIAHETPTHINRFLNVMGKKLVALDLPYVPNLSIPYLAECCPNLTSLILRNVRSESYIWECQGPPYRIDLPGLTTFKIQNAHFYTPGSAHALKLIVSSAKCIRTLSLRACRGLTDELVHSLRLYDVQEMDASLSDISTESLRDLLVHGSMQKLVINCSYNITPTDYFLLTSCRADDTKNPVDIVWSYHDGDNNSIIPRRLS